MQALDTRSRRRHSGDDYESTLNAYGTGMVLCSWVVEASAADDCYSTADDCWLSLSPMRRLNYGTRLVLMMLCGHLRGEYACCRSSSYRVRQVIAGMSGRGNGLFCSPCAIVPQQRAGKPVGLAPIRNPLMTSMTVVV
jgi:hypothetical protein